MPTGYTSKLYDGEQEFTDFITGAAHAFGAMINFRDAGVADLDKRIDQMANEESYESRRLAESEAELDRLLDLTTDELEQEFQEERDATANANVKSIRLSNERHKRYSKMIGEVAAWIPPTKDHQGLKDFMIQQLTDSMQFDCKSYTVKITDDRDVWQAGRVAQARKDISYYSQELEKSEERRAGRIQWTRDLINSIKDFD